MSQERQAQARILPSKITVEISELSARQKKSILGLVREMGFTPEEISEIAVVINPQEIEMQVEPGAVG